MVPFDSFIIVNVFCWLCSGLFQRFCGPGFMRKNSKSSYSALSNSDIQWNLIRRRGHPNTWMRREALPSNKISRPKSLCLRFLVWFVQNVSCGRALGSLRVSNLREFERSIFNLGRWFQVLGPLRTAAENALHSFFTDLVQFFYMLGPLSFGRVAKPKFSQQKLDGHLACSDSQPVQRVFAFL